MKRSPLMVPLLLFSLGARDLPKEKRGEGKETGMCAHSFPARPGGALLYFPVDTVHADPQRPSCPTSGVYKGSSAASCATRAA